LRRSVAAALIFAPTLAFAQGNPVDQLIACRAEANPQKRLACLDSAAAEIERTRASGELRITLKREELKRQAREFGQAEPVRRVKEKRGLIRETPDAPRPIEVKAIQSTIAGATRPAETQLWVILLADGSIWRELDGGRSTDVLKPGTKVEVRKGILGSFILKVEGQTTALRVKRMN
jgi:hypothetical protein